MDGVACAHEWEQVWFERGDDGVVRLVGPFRCRHCKALKEPQSADAVDPVESNSRRLTTRARVCVYD